MRSSSIASKFELSIDILCNPTATNAAIESLVKKAETFGDTTLANQLDSLNISKKRQAFGAIDTSDVDEGSAQVFCILFIKMHCI